MDAGVAVAGHLATLETRLVRLLLVDGGGWVADSTLGDRYKLEHERTVVEDSGSFNPALHHGALAQKKMADEMMPVG